METVPLIGRTILKGGNLGRKILFIFSYLKFLRKLEKSIGTYANGGRTYVSKILIKIKYEIRIQIVTTNTYINFGYVWVCF